MDTEPQRFLTGLLSLRMALVDDLFVPHTAPESFIIVYTSWLIALNALEN